MKTSKKDTNVIKEKKKQRERNKEQEKELFYTSAYTYRNNAVAIRSHNLRIVPIVYRLYISKFSS